MNIDFYQLKILVIKLFTFFVTLYEGWVKKNIIHFRFCLLKKKDLFLSSYISYLSICRHNGIFLNEIFTHDEAIITENSSRNELVTNFLEKTSYKALTWKHSWDFLSGILIAYKNMHSSGVIELSMIASLQLTYRIIKKSHKNIRITSFMPIINGVQSNEVT